MDDVESTGYRTLRERISTSNTIWITLLVLIIAITIISIFLSLRTSETVNEVSLEEDPIGVYTDSDHRDFAKQLVDMAEKRGVTIEAHFISDKAFKIVVPCDISSDELSYISRYAAMGIWRRFRVSPTVWTYIEDISSPNPRLTAQTRWSSERGEFIVSFERSLGSE